MTIVRPESTHWRDEALSKQHRGWGWHMPCSDIDWLVTESAAHKVRVIVEYKHVRSMPADFAVDSFQIRTLLHLAHGHEDRLPVMIVNYLHSPSRIDWAFEVMTLAYQCEPRREEQIMTEYEYVAFLCRMKGQTPDWAVMQRLSRTLPAALGL